MRIIKILIAASEELHEEKMSFSSLIEHLNGILASRDIELKRVKWTPETDSTLDDFLSKLHDCEMCLNIYWSDLVGNSQEELDTAYHEFKNGNNPRKLYVFFKEPTKDITESLLNFKANFVTKYGHFFCKFENVDTMNLHFVLQFEAYQNSFQDDLIKVENGEVRLADMTIAHMENLRFVVDNPDYQRMRQRLGDLPLEIEDTRLLIKDHPDIERYQNKLQNLLEERNRLQKEFNQQQDLILNTAKRIATFQGEVITNRMRRAIEAFERGEIKETNIILCEEEKEGDAIFADFEKMEEIRIIKVNNIHSGIESLLLQTTTVMAEGTMPIQERIDRTIELYKKADYRASRTEYNKKKYSIFLFNYAKFLFVYGYYAESIKIYLRLIEMVEVETAYKARLYNNIGLAFKSLNDYSHAIKYYEKALEIFDNLVEKNHLSYAMTLNNIGNVYRSQEKYVEALDYQLKSLSILQKKLGKKHPFTAQQLNNIGNIYLCLDDYSKALNYYFPALAIFETTIGIKHIDTATLYNNMGSTFLKKGDSENALMYYEKALEIREEKLGKNHPDTIITYRNISCVYEKKGYGYTKWASDKASLCRNIGFVFDFQDNNTDNYDIAIKYYQKSLGMNNVSDASDAIPSKEMKDYINKISTKKDIENSHALDYYNKILKKREAYWGVDSCYVADIYSKIGLVYYNMGDYENALSYYKKALDIFEKELGISHNYVVNMNKIINLTKQQLYSKSANKK